MAYISYLDQNEMNKEHRVNDKDNIIQIHSINGSVMKSHYDMYLTLMRKRSPLNRIQREEIAVVISTINECNY